MRHRLAIILPIFLAIYVASYYTAFLLRCDFEIPAEVQIWFWATLPVVIALKFLICLMTGEWQRTFRYASLPDVQWVVIGASLSALAIYLVNLTLFAAVLFPIPRSVIVIDGVLSITLSAFLRMGCRAYTESFRPYFQGQPKNPTLIYGTGPEGIGILRAIQAGDRAAATKAFLRVRELLGQAPPQAAPVLEQVMEALEAGEVPKARVPALHALPMGKGKGLLATSGWVLPATT